MCCLQVRLTQSIRGCVELISKAGSVYYNTNQKLERNHEEAEARMDELEGTLRGHIGLIEESLERIEGTLKSDSTEGGWGKGMNSKTEELYAKREKDEKIG